MLKKATCQILYQMKKITNKLFAISLLLLISCGKEIKENPEEISITINEIVGIGKVIPKDGIVLLSVDQPKKITKLNYRLGDTIAKGSVIFETEAQNELLAIKENQAVLQADQAALKVLGTEVKQEEIKLKDAISQWNLSKRLALKNAETKEKLREDSIAVVLQKQVLQQKRHNLNAQKKGLSQKEIQIQSSELAFNQQKFIAPQDGILTQFDVTLGEILTPNTVFGELATLSELVIEGEIDELYAHKIKLGQKVRVALVGQNQNIGRGTIVFVGTGLQNKSILYETIGEGMDRRVRRFTVKLDDTNSSLFINQKVECKIEL